MNILAENISRRRKELKMTQKQLAVAAKIAVGTMSSYENGEHVPPVDAAYRIACVLEVTLDELFTDSLLRCPHCGKLIN